MRGSFLKFFRVLLSIFLAVNFYFLESDDLAYAQTITPTEIAGSPSKVWNAMASSSDGTKLVVGSSGEGAYYSVDSGANWSYLNWVRTSSIAISSDGSKIYQTSRNNQNSYLQRFNLTTSTFNSVRPDGYECWDLCSVTASSDGTKIALSTYGGDVWFSSNSGDSWTKGSGRYLNLVGIAGSSDLGSLYIIREGGYIYKSVDNAATWIELTAAGSREWQSVASSSNGQVIIASVYGGNVWKSTNGGTSWTQLSNIAGTRMRLAISSNGSVLAAADYKGLFKVSSDGGATWDSDSTNRYWNAIAMNNDGSKIIAGSGDGPASQVFSLNYTPAPVITAPSAPNLLSATAGDAQVSISFTAGSDNGSVITNYKYSLNSDTYTALSPIDTTTPVVISGLTNGTQYWIRLKAVNAIGDSVASESVTVTPTAPSPQGPSAEEIAAQRAAAAEAQRVAAIEARRIEAERVAVELEAARVAAEAETKRLAAEAETKRLAAEAETKRLAAEAETKRLAAEAETKRLAAEIELKRLVAQAEVKRQAAEADAAKVASDALKVVRESQKIYEQNLKIKNLINVIPNSPESLPIASPKSAPTSVLLAHIQIDIPSVENGGIEFFGTKTQPRVVNEDGRLTPLAPLPGSGQEIPGDALTTSETFIGQVGGITFNAPDVAVPIIPKYVCSIELNSNNIEISSDSTGVERSASECIYLPKALGAIPGAAVAVQTIGKAYANFANIGNDMSPITRKKAKKVLVATIVVGQISTMTRRFGN